MRGILAKEELWVKQCMARGVTEGGLLRSEAQLPTYLRRSKRGKGEVVRAKGGGRNDELEFLYPCVKSFFEDMRLYGRFVTVQDLRQ